MPATRNFKIALYLPHAADPVTYNDWWKRTATFFATFCGGCTEFEATGTWMNDKGEVIGDRISVFYSFITADQFYSRVQQPFRAFATGLATELHQESVAVEINGVMEFIPG